MKVNREVDIFGDERACEDAEVTCQFLTYDKDTCLLGVRELKMALYQGIPRPVKTKECLASMKRVLSEERVEEMREESSLPDLC